MIGRHQLPSLLQKASARSSLLGMRDGALNRIEEAIREIRNGRIIIMVGARGSKSEGDFVMAAEKVTHEAINFMATWGRGLICVPMLPDRLDELSLPLMVPGPPDPTGKAFALSVDLANDSTGISAFDRAATIRRLLDAGAVPNDFRRPGHVLPIRAEPGGVFRRARHAEAALDLVRVSGLFSACVTCEIMSEDGTMARLPELEALAAQHSLKIISIGDVVDYRWRTEGLVHRRAEACVATPSGSWLAVAYEDVLSRNHLAFVRGDIGDGESIATRLHAECLSRGIFHSLTCDCEDQLDQAMGRIASEKRGVIVCFRGRDEGDEDLFSILRSQRPGPVNGRHLGESNVDSEQLVGPSNFALAAQVLADLGVRSVRLITNEPTEWPQLEANGVRVSGCLSMETQGSSQAPLDSSLLSRPAVKGRD